MSAKEIILPKRKAVLVAGGAGFLGSHLCDRLVASGHVVYCVDNLQTGLRQNLHQLEQNRCFTFIQHDIRDPLPKGLKVDEIYNLACPASPLHYQADPIYTLMTCVVGTRQLLEFAARNSARFVQASTSEVYGDPLEHPQNETYWGHVNPVGPRACYDEGKRAAEALCFDYLRLGKVDLRVARIFNTYGPRMRADDGRIISNFIMQALSGRPLTIYGSGKQTRSFCYVSDLIQGLMALMAVTATLTAPVNLGNPQEFTVLKLAKLILALTGSSSELSYEPLPIDDPQRRKPNIERARDLLRWSPTTSLPQGLPPTVVWFGECGQAIGGKKRPLPVDYAPRPVIA
ncbi:MAG TPA: UDP-glucuronic acid decarboxylase family protein [Ferrovibrio sp.]|uniref:UDP-glucuronic acid decarboxylase family protein n=1 Tax=Ferrovibrio sp. TaxID=1917215 RepID=UPI002ED2190D